MHIPRRHSRRLLLPPGWVALGFLLLLGCQVLLTHQRQLRVETVLQLTMPVSKKYAEQQRREGVPYALIFYWPLALIQPNIRWHDAAINGTPLHDFVNEATIENMVLAIQADFSHASGIRINFCQGATYGNLASLLDAMNKLGQHKYWLGVEQQHTTFYVINDEAVHPKEDKTPSYIGPCFVCTSGDYVSPVAVPTFLQLAQKALAELWQPAWQPTTLLFATLSALSFYRLAHR